MPIDYSEYPDNWPEISFRIRFDRAKNRCECRGECGRDHSKEWIIGDIESYWEDCITADDELDSEDKERCAALNHTHHPITDSLVVLTVAHLDHDKMSSAEDNLMAMCQRCHLRYDHKEHAINAAETRRQQARDAGQLDLL